MTTAVPAAPAVAREIFRAGLAAATTYAEVLADEGVRLGLLGPREGDRVWERHVLNCALVAPLIPSQARVVDLGSGAGLPGIPLALARPDLRVILVEPLLRRAEFLGRVVGLLGLDDRVEVVRARAEDLRDCSVDIVTARAVAPLGKLAAWALPLTSEDGEVLAIRGASAREEVQRDQAALRAAGSVVLAVESCGAGSVAQPTTVVRMRHRS